MSLVGTFPYRGVRYLVERVECCPETTLLKVVFILRGPKNRSYGLIPTAGHPDLFFAVSATGFWRSTPFDGARFRVVGDSLVIAGDE